MKWINRLYIIFLGIILTLTTGFGIAAFYPEPQRPNYPQNKSQSVISNSCYANPESKQSPECAKELADYDQTLKRYEDDLKIYENKVAGYTRTTIFFGIVIGAIFAVAGLGMIKLSRLIANGIMFAGVLTAVLTRLVIMVSSLGASVTGTGGINSLSVIEFVVLAILSAAVINVGLTTLKDQSPQSD